MGNGLHCGLSVTLGHTFHLRPHRVPISGRQGGAKESGKGGTTSCAPRRCPLPFRVHLAETAGIQGTARLEAESNLSILTHLGLGTGGAQKVCRPSRGSRGPCFCSSSTLVLGRLPSPPTADPSEEEAAVYARGLPWHRVSIFA